GTPVGVGAAGDGRRERRGSGREAAADALGTPDGAAGAVSVEIDEIDEAETTANGSSTNGSSAHGTNGSATAAQLLVELVRLEVPVASLGPHRRLEDAFLTLIGGSE
ncbi:ABC transporter ATP-binding protein, partial [Streptomyces sporangiiformans]